MKNIRNNLVILISSTVILFTSCTTYPEKPSDQAMKNVDEMRKRTVLPEPKTYEQYIQTGVVKKYRVQGLPINDDSFVNGEIVQVVQRPMIVTHGVNASPRPATHVPFILEDEVITELNASKSMRALHLESVKQGQIQQMEFAKKMNRLERDNQQTKQVVMMVGDTLDKVVTEINQSMIQQQVEGIPDVPSQSNTTGNEK
jgi:hypothetical protein